MSQKAVKSFRREQQEGLVVGKGARSPGEKEGEWAGFPVTESWGLLLPTVCPQGSPAPGGADGRELERELEGLSR